MRKIFRNLITMKEALQILETAFKSQKLPKDVVDLEYAVGRVLAEDVISNIDVPNFDRSAMDGYAVVAKDVINAKEHCPVKLFLKGRIEAGQEPDIVVCEGEAVEVSTGAPIPKGANAVVMVEYTQESDQTLSVFRSVVPNENITSTGSDISIGEIILRRRTLLTYREVGMLAAIGQKKVKVITKPKIAILSTGNELVPPGALLGKSEVYDINSYSLYSALLELGCTPILKGIIHDDHKSMKRLILEALESSDVVLTSGSTSAGFGDMIYKVFEEIDPNGMLIHGLTIKPGKPTVVANLKGKTVFGLPGYPASTMSIFNILVKPYLSKLLGRRIPEDHVIKARLALKAFKAKGRQELLPVHLIRHSKNQYTAYPILKGSGAITSFSLADGYVNIPANIEFIDEKATIEVNLYSTKITPANLVFIGSHCPGVDLAISMLLNKYPEYKIKVISIGSLGGLNAALTGEADIAGIHLLDESGTYNVPFVTSQTLMLIRGYNREQGFLFEKNVKFTGLKDLIQGNLMFINRNKGSGTRVLIDSIIQKYCRNNRADKMIITERIKGYNIEAKTHSAVASAIRNGKAEIGVGIKSYADWYNLNFIPLTTEHYDFVIPKDKIKEPEIVNFIQILKSSEYKLQLESRMPGYFITKGIGQIVSKKSQ